MTVLSHNMKLIRKRLNCTQTVFSQILEIGFRTYVRYESGERDVPAVVLVKISNLGNVSLDRLLTTRLDETELNQPDDLAPPEKPESLAIVGGSLQEGRIMLKGYRDDFLITLNPGEKKVLNHFRTLSPATRTKCLGDMEKILADKTLVRGKGKVRETGKSLQRKNISQLKKIIRSVKKVTVK